MNPNSNIPLGFAISAGIRQQQNHPVKAGEGPWQIIPGLDNIRGCRTAGTVIFNSCALLATASECCDTQVHTSSSLAPECPSRWLGHCPSLLTCSQHWLDLLGFLIPHLDSPEKQQLTASLSPGRTKPEQEQWKINCTWQCRHVRSSHGESTCVCKLPAYSGHCYLPQHRTPKCQRQS